MLLSSCHPPYFSTLTLFSCVSLSMSAAVSSVDLCGYHHFYSSCLAYFFRSQSILSSYFLLALAIIRGCRPSIVSETTFLHGNYNATLLSGLLCQAAEGLNEELYLYYVSRNFSLLSRPRCSKEPPSCVLAVTPVKVFSSCRSHPPQEWAVQMTPLLTSH